VGIEVVKDPAIIFLDEPTTGLDSEMALGVISSLKAMAKAGKMVRDTSSLLLLLLCCCCCCCSAAAAAALLLLLLLQSCHLQLAPHSAMLYVACIAQAQ
jgi:hypothetical protein